MTINVSEGKEIVKPLKTFSEPLKTSQNYQNARKNVPGDPPRALPEASRTLKSL